MSGHPITLTVDPLDPRVGTDDPAGWGLAAILREAAAAVEATIQILPWPGGEWTPETHQLTPAVTLHLNPAPPN